MARPRLKLTNEIENEIRQRTARGESSVVICAALRGAVSRAKIERMRAEMRTSGVPSSAARPRFEIEAEEIPENLDGTPLATIDRYAATVERGIQQAERDGNLAAVGQLVAKATALVEARRKAVPLPKIDLNDSPDYQKLADQGEKQLLQLVDALFPRDSAK